MAPDASVAVPSFCETYPFFIEDRIDHFRRCRLYAYGFAVSLYLYCEAPGSEDLWEIRGSYRSSPQTQAAFHPFNGSALDALCGTVVFRPDLPETQRVKNLLILLA